MGIETTVEDARSAPGRETTRGQCRSTALRAGACRLRLWDGAVSPQAGRLGPVRELRLTTLAPAC